MKNLYQIGFTILAFTISVNLSWGQIFEIQSPGIRDVPPGHNHNSSFGFQFKIKNVSGQPYSGPLNTMVEVIGGGTRRIDSAYTSLIGNGNNYTIFVDTFAVDTPFFSMGRNGIVVWVVDDNFDPLSNTDSTDLFVTNQPSFLLGETGLRYFDPVVDTSQWYDFGLRVANVNEDDYDDYLYLNIEAHGTKMRIPSQNPIFVKGNKHENFTIGEFKYPTPPFFKGMNNMRLWVDGSNNAPSLDTIQVEVELVNGPVAAAEPSEAAGLEVKSPTRGPILIKVRPGLAVTGLELYDLSGRKVLENQGRSVVDLSSNPHCSEGLYWLNIKLSDGSQHQTKLLFAR